MATNYINSHIEKRIIGYFPIQRRSLRIGQIVNFYYPNAPNNKHPFVIVLNPNFQNKLHGMLLNYMPLRAVDRFRRFIIEEAKEVTEDEPRGTGLFGWGRTDRFVSALKKLSSESQTPESFYRIRLKEYLTNVLITNVYRTYKYDEIKNLRLVAYRFGKE